MEFKNAQSELRESNLEINKINLIQKQRSDRRYLFLMLAASEGSCQQFYTALDHIFGNINSNQISRTKYEKNRKKNSQNNANGPDDLKQFGDLVQFANAASDS